MKRVHLLISGRVQGVAFRYYTIEEADRLGVLGWVRNLPDGRVEVVAEGEPERIEAFARWCHRGPALARVDEVKMETPEATGEFRRFDIRY